jgi:hypothetical protein
VTAETIEMRLETEPERELRAVEVVREVLPVLRGALLHETRLPAREQLRKAIDSCDSILIRRARR